MVPKLILPGEEASREESADERVVEEMLLGVPIGERACKAMMSPTDGRHGGIGGTGGLGLAEL